MYPHWLYVLGSPELYGGFSCSSSHEFQVVEGGGLSRVGGRTTRRTRTMLLGNLLPKVYCELNATVLELLGKIYHELYSITSDGTLFGRWTPKL